MNAIEEQLKALRAAINDHDAKPELDMTNWSCKSCGEWTPHWHPERHAHKENCAAQLDCNARNATWKARALAAATAIEELTSAADAAQDDGTPYAQQSLMRWGQALSAEGNSLGEPLVAYASRWARDISLDPCEQAANLVTEYETLVDDTKPGSWCDRTLSFLRRFGLSTSGS